MSKKKKKKKLMVLNYIEDLLILLPMVTRCVSICDFASLFHVPIGNVSSAAGLKICLMTAEIKRKSQ